MASEGRGAETIAKERLDVKPMVRKEAPIFQ